MRHGVVTNSAPITLEQLFRFYRGLPHQAAAIETLEQDLAVNGYAVAMRRDRAWFQIWSQDGKQADLAAALKLIKEFEGCHLEAYRDPLHGWDVATIGYGTTRYPDGRKVKQGDKINAIEADMLLRQEVDRIAEKLRTSIPAWGEIADHQKCALISFAYNLGSDFYGARGFETISRELREKDWAAVPAALLLYRNPGTNVEAGLKRRRIAEGTLWTGAQPPPPPPRPAKVKPADPFSTKLSPHFTLGEFALGEPARRFVAQHQVDTATELAAFLERVRTAFGGKRVTITSGYRPAAINRAVGGASNSEHLYDAPGVGAVDFYVDGVDIKKVQDWVDREWPYSVGYGAPKGFVHLGIRKGRPRVRWDY
jgi:GH24 family phage-related lysozyme (muramidase)